MHGGKYLANLCRGDGSRLTVGVELVTANLKFFHAFESACNLCAGFDIGVLVPGTGENWYFSVFLSLCLEVGGLTYLAMQINFRF